jgi:hypothetical protein
MDTSDLRKRILRALDDARKDASARRGTVDEAARAYATFLNDVAVPLMRQATTVLNAEGHKFSVHTPANGVRLASDSAPETFLEFELDTTSASPQVIGRISLQRGRQGQVVSERPIVEGKAVSLLDEQDVTKFLVDEVSKLIVKI